MDIKSEQAALTDKMCSLVVNRRAFSWRRDLLCISGALDYYMLTCRSTTRRIPELTLIFGHTHNI